MRGAGRCKLVGCELEEVLLRQALTNLLPFRPHLAPTQSTFLRNQAQVLGRSLGGAVRVAAPSNLTVDSCK